VAIGKIGKTFSLVIQWGESIAGCDVFGATAQISDLVRPYGHARVVCVKSRSQQKKFSRIHAHATWLCLSR